MPPVKTTATRWSARHGRPSARICNTTPSVEVSDEETDMTTDIGQLVAEQLAALIPTIVAQIRDSTVQSSDVGLPTVEVKHNSGKKRSGSSRHGKLWKKARRQTIRRVVTPEIRSTYQQCERCGNKHAKDVTCWKCFKCKKLGHTVGFCKSYMGKCYECGSAEHLRNRCPELVAVGVDTSSDLDSRGKALVIEAQETQQDPRVVTGTFPYLTSVCIYSIFDSNVVPDSLSVANFFSLPIFSSSFYVSFALKPKKTPIYKEVDETKLSY